MDEPLLKRTNLRQLNQWVEIKEEEVDFKKPVKGVYLLTYDIKTDPKDRQNYELESAAAQYLEKMEFCIMTTSQLFTLYNKIEDGEMKNEELLNLISSTAGSLNLEN